MQGPTAAFGAEKQTVCNQATEVSRLRSSPPNSSSSGTWGPFFYNQSTQSAEPCKPLVPYETFLHSLLKTLLKAANSSQRLEHSRRLFSSVPAAGTAPAVEFLCLSVLRAGQPLQPPARAQTSSWCWFLPARSCCRGARHQHWCF